MLQSPWNAVTPATIVAVALAGVILAWFMWSLGGRVRPHILVANWVAGAAFVALVGTARWVDGVDTWPVWIGIGALWTEYVIVAGAGVLTWRRWKGRKTDG